MEEGVSSLVTTAQALIRGGAATELGKAGAEGLGAAGAGASLGAGAGAAFLTTFLAGAFLMAFLTALFTALLTGRRAATFFLAALDFTAVLRVFLATGFLAFLVFLRATAMGILLRSL